MSPIVRPVASPASLRDERLSDTGGEASIFDDVDASPAVADGTIYVGSSLSAGSKTFFALPGERS